MKIALIDVKGNDDRSIKGSTAMNIRNMVVLSEYLGAKFFYNSKQLIENKEIYDVLVFGFGGISSNIEQIRQFAKTQNPKKIYWLKTEYDSTNPSLYYFCKDTSSQFTTIQNMVQTGGLGKFCQGVHFLNLNLLIAKSHLPVFLEKKYDCIYYSRWRPDRAVYLKEYLQRGIFFSSDTKNFKKHKHIGCNPRYIKKLSWDTKKPTLALFRYSLYLEDNYTHRVFNNLGNRWYEAGFCNNVVFFDKSCINTIKKSEIKDFFNEIEYYIVSGHNNLMKKIEECNKDFEKHLRVQKRWRENEQELRSKVLKDIRDIVYGNL